MLYFLRVFENKFLIFNFRLDNLKRNSINYYCWAKFNFLKQKFLFLGRKRSIDQDVCGYVCTAEYFQKHLAWSPIGLVEAMLLRWDIIHIEFKANSMWQSLRQKNCCGKTKNIWTSAAFQVSTNGFKYVLWKGQGCLTRRRSFWGDQWAFPSVNLLWVHAVGLVCR